MMRGRMAASVDTALARDSKAMTVARLWVLALVLSVPLAFVVRLISCALLPQPRRALRSREMGGSRRCTSWRRRERGVQVA